VTDMAHFPILSFRVIFTLSVFA